MNRINKLFRDKKTSSNQSRQNELKNENSKLRWYQPLDTSDNFTGVNDSSYYTFRDSRYEGLAREILQNSLDEQLDKTKPVKVEFSLVEVNTKDIPDFENYKKLFEDGYESWKDDSQPNGKDFFDEALKALSKDKIKVMRISDFNTNGVLGSQTVEIRSAKDITPWYNLIKSEASSSKGETQGGSFGIGKNATFANSITRTILYSTYDNKNQKSHEGVAKLATVFKNNERYSSKCYYGSIVEGKSIAINGLLQFPNYERKEYGTDIYIIGFEEDDLWEIRMIKTILSDFMIPIHNDDLEVNMNGENINKEILASLYDKYIEYCNNNRNKRTGTEIQSSKNYYEVLTSEKTQSFSCEFNNLGNANLKVLYNPDFERRILRTRETGMKLFEAGGVSSTIGFSGIVSLEGLELNKLFRNMENPAHTKWSADNISNSEMRKLGEKTRLALNRWMKNEVINNATDKNAETLEIEGLEEYLPDNLVSDPEDKKEEDVENISTKISNVVIKKTSREEEKKKKYSDGVKEGIGKPDDTGEPGEIGEPKNKDTNSKGGRNRDGDTNIGPGAEFVFRKIRNDNFTARLIKYYEYYKLILNFKKSVVNGKIKIFISGENSNVKPNIKNASNSITNINYAHHENEILLGDIIEDERLAINLDFYDENDYSLEVEIYESKRK